MGRIPLRLWGLAVLSGALQVLPFPMAGPAPLWRTAFCWVAMVPLLVAMLSQNRSGKPLSILDTALLGYASGTVWYAGNCYWIYQTMYLYGGIPKAASAGILVLFCLYLGLYHALFGFLVGAVRSLKPERHAALLGAPFLWVAVELARARITSFPWDQLGIAQVDNYLLTRLAPWTGAYGISFVILTVNALLAAALLAKRPLTWRILAAGVTLAILLQTAYLAPPLKHWLMYARQPGRTMATLVQENLNVGAEAGPRMSAQEMIAEFGALSRLPKSPDSFGSAESEESNAQSSAVPMVQKLPATLIVWPESPASFRGDDAYFRHEMSTLARETGATLILGSFTVEFDQAIPRGYALYNSAAFVTPDGTFAGRYDKMHLVPFGEYIPFKDAFFFAKNLTQQAGDMDHGQHRIDFTSSGHTYGTFICYESIFADEVRLFVRDGAQVLVNISDDGWYGDTSAPWQHLNMARMRAIENHRWLLRSTNTGITASIDPDGRVRQSAPRHIRTAIAVGFDYNSDLTFYTKYGDLFAYLCAFITIVLLVLAAILNGRYIGAKNQS